MRLLKYELYKIVTQKLFWGALIAVLVVNIASLVWFNRPEGLPHSETRAMFDAIRIMPRDDKIEYLESQAEFLQYFVLLENLESTREIVASGMSVIITYDDIVLIEGQLEELRERISGRFDLEQNITAEAARTQIELINQVIGELSVNHYAVFLDNVERAAERNRTLNIFGDENSFAFRNIEKTQADFAGMRDIVIRYDVNLGLETLFDSPSTDILLIILILVICIALISDEKEKRLFLLLKATPHGVGRTIAAKMGAMALCVFAVSLVVFVSNVIYAELTFGLGDLTRPIQSVPDLMISTMRISLGEFICLFFAIKTLGLITVGLVVMLITLHARHGIIALGSVGLLGVFSHLLSTIPVVSSWNWLRFLNFATLVRPYEVLRRYFNLNFFGFPVGIIPVFLIFVSVMLVLSILAVYFSYTKKRALENRSTILTTRFSRVRFGTLFVAPMNWRWYEFKKLAFTNKALLIVIVFIVIQILVANNAQPPPLGFEHNYIRSFLIANQGEVTEEAEEFILTQKAGLEHARSELNTLGERMNGGEIDFNEYLELRRPHDRTLAMEHVINTLYERLRYVETTPNAQFVYDAGYAELFGLTDESAGLTSGMALIAVLIFVLCGVFPIEYKTGMYKILNTTNRGHSETIQMKLILSLLFAAVVFVCAYLPDLLYIGQHYGFAGLSLPLSSIPPTEIAALPTILGGIPIRGYLVLMLFTRFVVCVGIAAIILAISLIIRHNLYTALCAFGILLSPLAFHVFGLTFLDNISLFRLITANGLFNIYPTWQVVVQCVAFLALCSVSVLFVVRRFGKADVVDFRVKFIKNVSLR